MGPSVSKNLKKDIKLLMFDQYGTLVDIQKGLTDMVTPFLQTKGWKGKIKRLIKYGYAIHREQEVIFID